MSKEEQEQQQKCLDPKNFSDPCFVPTFFPDPNFISGQNFFLTQNNFWTHFFSDPKRCLEGENKASEV